MTTVDRLPVVFLHALAVNSAMWETQCAALSARGHRTLAPDQRGFGGTPLGQDPPSLELVADDLARGLDAAGIDRPILVGSSMGGYVAMAFLRRHPGRAVALALLATRASADTPDGRSERERFAGLITDTAARPAVLAATVPRLVGAATRAHRPELVDRVRRMVTAEDPGAIAWAQRAIAARTDATDTLRELDVPALVIAGEQDELVTAGEHLDLARTLPRGELSTVADAGHLAPLEAPEAVTAALTGLIEKAQVH